MSETSTILAASMFIGVLALFSVSAANTIPELENLTGTEKYENFSDTITEIEITDFNESDSVNLTGSAYIYDGTTNDRNESYGYLIYDVSGIERMNIGLDSRLLNSVEIVYLNGSKDVLASESYPGDTFTYDREAASNFAGENPAFIEIRLTGDNRLLSLDIVNDGQGLIGKISGLVNIFTSLSSNTVWFNLIVAIPIGIVAIWLFAQVAKDVIPLT